jgi:NifB/MoaA-like Fe-S oxidoreductase
VLPITNQRLGETITVAGLLMAGDVLNQLQTAGYGDLVILPRVMFDHPETIALDDLSPQDIANKLGRPLALADTMGDVWDALIGQSHVVYQPGNTSDEVIPLRLLNNDELHSNQHLS